MSGNDQDGLSRLRWSIRALAQPKVVQETLFPGFVCLADELALDFEESLEGTQRARASLAPAVSGAVRRLDEQLEKMSSPQRTDLWTNEALARSAEWETVRELALAVVRAAGWPTSPPEPNPQIYIGPPS